MAPPAPDPRGSVGTPDAYTAIKKLSKVGYERKASASGANPHRQLVDDRR